VQKNKIYDFYLFKINGKIKLIKKILMTISIISLLRKKCGAERSSFKYEELLNKLFLNHF